MDNQAKEIPRRPMRKSGSRKETSQRRWVCPGDGGIHSQGPWLSVLMDGEGFFCLREDTYDLGKNNKMAREELSQRRK